MKLTTLKTTENIEIDGPLLITPNIFEDSRGFFYESWNKEEFFKLTNMKVDFVQDNHSKSSNGVLRGLHYQLRPYPQAKLVRCIKGDIFDVIVDLRIKSKTFGKWSSAVLSQQNHNELWVPEGFAHGFLTTSDSAEVIYKTTNYWAKDFERSILWNDREISIKWPIEFLDSKYPKLSIKDKNAPTLEEAISKSEVF